MCGIAALLRLTTGGGAAASEALVAALVAAFHDVLHRRGPDGGGEAAVETPAGLLRLLAHVLHLRGDVMTPQPCANDAGDLLCWNGEVFGGLEVPAGAR